ncbi:water channel [Fragilaria crotonensis]|nr:water channel [Fragilaria crotonensis]
MKLSKITRAVLAEFVAVTLLVFVGCGTVVSSQWLRRPDENPTDLNDAFLTSVALAFGIGIAVLAFSIAPISGGHINPAVTFAFVLLRKMSLIDGLMYVVAQFLGGILGAAILWGCTDVTGNEYAGTPPFKLGSNEVSGSIGSGSAFLIETMGTFILVWTVMMTAVHKKSIAGNMAPIAIGWSVLLAHLVLLPFTGCGINPARSAGPHFVTAIAGTFVGYRGVWVFYTAPFVGAGAAALLTSFIFGLNEDEEEEEEEEEEFQNAKSVGEVSEQASSIPPGDVA